MRTIIIFGFKISEHVVSFVCEADVMVATNLLILHVWLITILW